MKRSFIFAVIAVLIMAWTCPAMADTLYGVTQFVMAHLHSQLSLYH